MKVFWLSPNLNHYKVKLLNNLANSSEINLTVLAGTGRRNMGDKDGDVNPLFQLIETNVSKKKFGYSSSIRFELYKIFRNYDWVLIPREKKNIILFTYAVWLRTKTKFFKSKYIRLISYNHPTLKSKGNRITVVDKLLTKFFYKFYDRIIFYTEISRNAIVERKAIKEHKAYWANNTIDTAEIQKYYKFSYPNLNEPTILFIGRLLPSKKLDLLFKYYFELQKLLNNVNKTLKLIIIGDGPERKLVEQQITLNNSIEWKGAIVSETEIAPLMKRASLVFVPGHSGLSINHAFAYGRPYVTIYGNHPPEIDYLINDKNGLILKGNINENVERISNLLNDKDKLNKMCNNAFQSSKELSIENWVQQIVYAFER